MSLLACATSLATGVGLVACGTFGADKRVEDADGGLDATTTDGPTGGDATPDGASSCVADTANDPKNCGRCGRDCLGGACGSGACSPFAVANSLNTPQNLTLGPTRIAWSGTASPLKRDVFSCARDQIPCTPGLVIGDRDDVRSLFLDTNQLFIISWNTTGGPQRIEVCDPASCPASISMIDSTNSTFPAYSNVRKDQDGFFWGKQDTDRGRILRWTVSSKKPDPVLATECPPGRIVVGPSDIAWACHFGQAVSGCGLPCAVDGGTRLADGSAYPIKQLERGTGYLVWDDELGAINVRETNGMLRALAPRGKGPIALVGDDLVFFDGITNQIKSCTLPACATPTVIAKSVTMTSMVADATAVYWADATLGTILGVAR